MDGNDVCARPAVGRWWWLRRPPGLVAQTRWLFWMCAVLYLVLAQPGTFAVATSTTVPLAISGDVVLLSVWAFRYLSGCAPLTLDLVEAGAVTTLALCVPETPVVLGVVFAALWFRALYGTTTRIVLMCSFVAAGLVVALPLRALLTTPETAPIGMLVPTVVGMFVTAAVSRYLALSLFAREQAQRRDAALVRLGNRLIGVTDRAEVQARAQECAGAICAATPGLSALRVRGTAEGLVVLDHVGALRDAPATLPRSTVSPGAGADVATPVADPSGLERLAGTGTAWVSVPLPDDDGWTLLGAPRRVGDEAVVAVQTMTNLVTLALRTSDAHQDLTTQATHDALTGLANRVGFAAALDRALADPDGRVALLFLDLDDFKTVNDGLGHAAGDALLRHVADRLRWAVRPDDLCARLGGDEFAVLLRDADDSAAGVGQRLVELVASPVSLKGQLAHVGASVGLAFAAGAGTSAEELVQHADIAMYAAKAKGKNRVQAFDPGLLQDRSEAGFEAEVAAATAAGELVVHYQPIVAVDDERCVAVEALVRWQHPGRGLLGPAEFVPTAERTGAIGEIGAFVLRRACADAASWVGPSGPLAVHVNVSAAQLTDPGFLDVVRGCLAEHGREPKSLVLEITEGMVLDSEPVRYALDHLAALGVAIAVDDFGTGYSALSVIRTLPLDIVKLDRSFLSNGPAQAADEAVVTAIVAMTARLGLSVVAEGVERPDQQQFLREVGAEAAQGHLFLRPAPADQLALWLRRQPAGDRAPGVVTPLGRTG